MRYYVSSRAGVVRGCSTTEAATSVACGSLEKIQRQYWSRSSSVCLMHKDLEHADHQRGHEGTDEEGVERPGGAGSGHYNCL
jgi:hypothetical protein